MCDERRRTARRAVPSTVRAGDTITQLGRFRGLTAGLMDLPPEGSQLAYKKSLEVGERQESMVEWLPTALTGERVVVRPPAPGDEFALVELATDALVRRYLGVPMDQATAEVRAGQKISDPRWGQFVILHRATGVVAGSGSLARKRGPWKISYQVRQAFWRQGLAGEAVRLVIAWFFAHTGEDLLIATTQRVNTGSRRLLERLGAQHAASFQQYGLDQERYEFYRPSPQTPST